MENASKALIIAGAILLSIAIIGIGMYVFNMASSTINKSNMSDSEVSAYNSQFRKYEGGNQNGATCKALCDTIRNHNAANQDDVTKQINVTYTNGGADLPGDPVDANNVANATSGAINGVKTQILEGRMYTVSFNYTNTGLIKTIQIRRQ